MDARNSTAMKQNERELVITRIFDAPPSLVYRMWTEKEHVMHWSAPRGFTVTFSEADLRPGGAWRACMRTPDGVDLWLGGIYREVVKDKRLVFTHAWDGPDGKPGHETLVTLIFEEHQGKTRFTLRQTGFASVESRDGHSGGWGETLDILGEYLATLAK